MQVRVPPARTRTDKASRGRYSIAWEFEQYELDRFGRLGLAAGAHHPRIEYSVHQEQERNGHKFVHGYIKFTQPVTYAFVHGQIGQGQYCNIKLVKDLSESRLRCMDSYFDAVPVEYSKED